MRSGHITDRGLTTADFPRLKPLTPHVYAWEDLHISGAGYTTNSLIVVTPEGVLVADGQGTPDATRKLIAGVAKLTTQPIRYVVICSDHGDHTGGNEAFAPGTAFLAHSISRAMLEKAAAAPDRAPGAPRIVLPTETVDDERVLTLGGMEIRIEHLGKAHAGGDLLVDVPSEGVLFLSEIYLHRIFPSMRTASPTSWIDVLKRAREIPAAIVVPGHGFVDRPDVLREELGAYHRALEAVVAEATRLHAAGLSVDTAATRANWGEYGAWTARDRNAAIAIRRVYDEIEGRLR